MNMNQFTQKTVEALQRAQSLAIEYQHMQVEQEHLMAALLEDPNGLISQLLTRMGMNADGLRKAVTDSLGRIPRVSGPGREADKVYISPEVEKALLEAESRAKQMKDEYLSVEHVWLGICASPIIGSKSCCVPSTTRRPISSRRCLPCVGQPALPATTPRKPMMR